MNQKDVSKLMSAELVSEFVDLCIQQNGALEEDDVAKYNRLLKRQMAIVEELKARPGDQRRVLIPLYEHEDVQVRLMASEMTLAVEPVKARATLEAIRRAKIPPYSFDAGMTLGMLDEGMFTPT